MPQITSGVGSGLDPKSIADSLALADVTPIKNRYDRLEASISTQLSALGQVKSSLVNFQATLTKLSYLSQFYAMQMTLSDPTILTATSSTTAAGNYQIQVMNLAASQSLATAPMSSPSTVVGSGTMTINFGTYSNNNSVFTVNPDATPATITITPAQNTLQGIRDAINNSNAGVQAAIVQDNQGARLTLTSQKTGQAYAMQISVTDDDSNNTDASGLSMLAYDPTTNVNNLTQTIAAADSQIQVNGLTLTQSTNQCTTAIEGVTLDLLKAQPGTTVQLSFATNSAQVTSLVNEFISQYNTTMAIINNLTRFNKDTKKGSTMQGDMQIRNLKFNLTSLATSSLNNQGQVFQTLGDIGIKTNSKGLLEMDNDVFNDALKNNFNDIGNLFSKTATASDSNIRINSVGIDVPAGRYDVNLSSYGPNSPLSGTIGGFEALSIDGTTLKGSDVLSDLSIDVLGGTTGPRGNITVTDGIASILNNFLNDYLGDQGSLSNRTSQLNKRIDDLNHDRDKLADRFDTLQKRYLNQFIKLDDLLTKMQVLGASLSQQLDHIPDLVVRRR